MKNVIKPLLFGILLLGQSVPVMAAKDPLSNNSEAMEWMVYSSPTTQAAIGRAANIGDAVLANSVLGKSAATMGFAEKSPEAKTFLTGALYAEALALTRDGQFEDAGKRLAALADLTADLKVSPALNNYLVRVNHLIMKKAHDRAALLEMLSLAQPFLDQHLGGQSNDMRFLFQTGAWLSDYGMAASAGEYRFLRQPLMLGRTIREMQRLEAPKGVINALQEIKSLTSKKDLGEIEAHQIQQLVKKMQELMS